MPLQDQRRVLWDLRRGINSHGITVIALVCAFARVLGSKREERSLLQEDREVSPGVAG